MSIFQKCVFASGFVLGFSACSSPPAREPENLDSGTEVLTLQLQPYVGRLVTLSPVLGEDTLRLLFDTGGGETLISPSVAEAISCDPRGRSVGFRMSGERVEWPMCSDLEFRFASESFHDPAVGVWDLMAILPEGLPHLDGLMSLKTFQDRLLTIDLAGRRIVLESEASFQARVNRMNPIQVRIATGSDGGSLTLFVRGRVSGSDEDLWFLLDSANLADVLLAPHVATDLESSDIEITLGDSLRVTAPARSSDIIYDGALSEAFLRQMVLSVDLRTGHAWATRSDAGS